MQEKIPGLECRPICNVHQCQIASKGEFDPPFTYLTDIYFDLREALDEQICLEEMVENGGPERKGK